MSLPENALGIPVRVDGASYRARSPSVQLQADDLDVLLSESDEWLQLTAGAFECIGSRTVLPAVRIANLALSCGVQIRSRVEPGRLVMLLLRPALGSRVLANGKAYASGCYMVVSGDELGVSVLGPASLVWIDVDRHVLPRSLPGLASVKYAVDWSDVPWRALSPARDVRDPSFENDLECAALSALRLAADHVGRAADANRERLVRTALELMWASIEEPMTLRDICIAAKCSVRTLIYVFNASFGMSPMKYFKVQRLNVAHRRLQNADASERIFDIAADCGFWHLGHFGVDYKAFFGTTPSMTPRHA